MQHLEDDMDDLFRRAADNYPLHTNSADWNAVSKKLADIPVVEDVKNKNYKYLLLLLLLLPLGILYKNYFTQNNNGHNAPANTESKISQNIPAAKKSTGTITSTQNADIITPAIALQNKSAVIKRTFKGKLNSVVSGNSSVEVMGDNTLSGNINKENDRDNTGNGNTVQNNKDAVDDKIEPIKQDIIPDNAFKESDNTKKLQKGRNQKERGLYAGILIGPDMSTIKFQSIKKIGISLGALLGYQFSKNISVEAGALWSVKNYYSDGKYFSVKNIRLPANAQIKTVDGWCNMVEIPFVLKYNFRSKGKTNFSTSAGISSYFMKKEYYDYSVDRNGQQYPYSSTYRNPSTDLAAAADFAVGFNRQIKGINLRIEPYIKVPLKGVGVGSLPITSTGFNIGITKKISR